MKASELLQRIGAQSQPKILEFKENLRQVELVKAFESCNNCGGKLRFIQRVDWLQYTVSEEGSCESCKGQIPARIFRLH